ncbi:PRADC1-like protein [Ostrinia furnacalis]|uniref:PRADC1-like protein n=1 Tax=Ostrinia furnacalis TaxID=93504 RepID=UPI00103A5358|nr:PRADC1-like protein [Ostrinia furnacalis]
MMFVSKFSLLLSFCKVFLLILFIPVVLPGANDLHFYDGSSSLDVIVGDIFFEIVEPVELRYSYRIRPAKDFGTTFNESFSFKNAKLVPTLPLHSCSNIVNHNDIAGHIALAERGDCSFVFKAAMAQMAGARAIIITEFLDKDDDYLIEMVDDKNELDINIPAAFLLGRSGATILRTLRLLHKSYAVVNLPINMTHTPVSKMNQPPWITW